MLSIASVFDERTGSLSMLRARLLASAIDYASVLGVVAGPAFADRRQSAREKVELRRVLTDRRFFPVFQPIVSLEGQRRSWATRHSPDSSTERPRDAVRAGVGGRPGLRFRARRDRGGGRGRPAHRGRRIPGRQRVARAGCHRRQAAQARPDQVQRADRARGHRACPDPQLRGIPLGGRTSRRCRGRRRRRGCRVCHLASHPRGRTGVGEARYDPRPRGPRRSAPTGARGGVRRISAPAAGSA